MMYKMLRKHGSLKKNQEIKLEGKQAELFVNNGFAELLSKPCEGCEDDKKECSECEKHAESKKAPVKKKTTSKKSPDKD